MVDKMSYVDPMNSFDIDLLKWFFFLSPAPVLLDWVEYPSEDWGFSLALALLNHVESVCD